jgi:hypothetical protein
MLCHGLRLVDADAKSLMLLICGKGVASDAIPVDFFLGQEVYPVGPDRLVFEAMPRI